MSERHWHPYDWNAPVEVVCAKIKRGDVVHNPVFRDDCSRSRELADQVDAALRVRGMCLDHTHTLVGFVVDRRTAYTRTLNTRPTVVGPTRVVESSEPPPAEEEELYAWGLITEHLEEIDGFVDEFPPQVQAMAVEVLQLFRDLHKLRVSH